MPVTVQIYKKLLDDQGNPIPPENITFDGMPLTGIPADEVSYERGTQGNDGQGGFDYAYFGTAALQATDTYAPSPDGKVFFVKLLGGQIVDLSAFPDKYGDPPQPPDAVLDGFEVWSPNLGNWTKAFTQDPISGQYRPNPIIISKEGEVFDATTEAKIFPLKARFVVNPTDPTGRHEFFLVARVFQI